MAYMPINPVGGGQQADPLSGLVAQEMGQSDVLNQGYQNYLQHRNLAQNQGQFEAGLAEQARQREHELGQLRFGAEMQAQENQARRLFESDQARLDRESRAAERKAMQDWEMKKFATEQRLTLKLAQINALKEQAIASGQAQAIADYDKEIQVIEDERAKNASQLAIAKKAYETGTTDINTLYADFNRTIQQKIAAAELANTQGNEFAKPALQAFLEEGSVLSEKQLYSLAQKQGDPFAPMGSLGDPVSLLIRYFTSQGLTEEQARVASRELSGLQYLNLKPGASIFSGLKFDSQASAAFVDNYKTADEIAQINRGMLSKSIARQFGNLPGAANINPQKVEQALQMIMAADDSSPANREQAISMLVQSGASPDVLDTLLNQMSMDLVSQTESVSKQIGAEAGRDPEASLAGYALQAQVYGLKDAAAQLRKARRYLGTTNVTSLRNVALGLDVAKQSGQVGDLLRAELRGVGLDPTRLERGYAGQKSALADIDARNLMLEDLDRRYRTAERMGAQRVTVAPKVAASQAELAAIRAPIDEMGGGVE